MRRWMIATVTAGLVIGLGGCNKGGDSGGSAAEKARATRTEKKSAASETPAEKAPKKTVDKATQGTESPKMKATKMDDAKAKIDVANALQKANTSLAAPPDVAAPPADAVKTASGLASKVLQKGTGTEHPTAEATVSVHYTGWTTDGKMFDSSVQRGSQASFPLNRVIAGWTEGLQLMVVGEKRRFWIPEDLAYKGRPGAPAGMLVFDVELFQIVAPPKPIPAPADVAAAPADAKKTESGIAYKVLTPGHGVGKPGPDSLVEVHYTGWTTDGKMFDSSVMRNTKAKFRLSQVILGWREGLQLMSVGEKTRFWIPKELAYNDRPGKPAGMLVFDVELFTFK